MSGKQKPKPIRSRAIRSFRNGGASEKPNAEILKLVKKPEEPARHGPTKRNTDCGQHARRFEIALRPPKSNRKFAIFAEIPKPSKTYDMGKTILQTTGSVSTLLG